ncbi:hypothetical protein [Methanococcus maripaludis]|uniref:Uncharacterized protein n=1 Tax=Methanococcus maripaludis TaxID=39152 RepID=A0A8T4CMT8_METMI|nr:hypothetical protein [Methanococcus maripaludis]MBM7408383.1 hypothetical protein [Methanococcus maripaludis]MBP2220053.1 hypothetical protein [Methanococcus maripaludis]
MDVKTAIDTYLNGSGKNKGRTPDERYSSFDYCYNYFYSFFRENRLLELADENNIQMSSLQLGNYLASFGMMRGSSFLLEKSVRHYRTLITSISKMDPILWKIDADSYNEENIGLLLNCKNQIFEALGKENKPTDTLITKIMLGVFGNVPAYDTNVKKSLKLNSLNEKSLLKIKDFYEKNSEIIDSYEIYTYDFLTSKNTDIKYTKAKLVDMYGFIDGMSKIRQH